MSSSHVGTTESFSPLLNSKLSDEYHRWFEVIPADTPELREKAYRLRFQVYCSENQYEVAEAHPKKMETDGFDHRSIHSLIVDRASGVAIGTVRLILPEPKSRKASFPIQEICSHPLPINPPMSCAAEISRFAVSKKLRKLAAADCPQYMKCLVVLGLMRAIVQMSLEFGITDWFAVMEPSLLKLLGRFSINFEPVGPLIEYHGKRQPCYANVDRMLERVRQENFCLWKFATEPHVFRKTGRAAGASRLKNKIR